MISLDRWILYKLKFKKPNFLGIFWVLYTFGLDFGELYLRDQEELGNVLGHFRYVRDECRRVGWFVCAPRAVEKRT